MLTQDELKQILSYNQNTGEFTRLTPLYLAGTLAGCKHIHGYILIRVNQKRYSAQQLAFLYMLGYIPKEIDHINLDRADNRWCNLREVTRSENMCNRKVLKSNTLGLKGVDWHKASNKYRARITKDGKLMDIGYSDCPAAAYFMYIVAADKFHGEFARTV